MRQPLKEGDLWIYSVLTPELAGRVEHNHKGKPTTSETRQKQISPPKEPHRDFHIDVYIKLIITRDAFCA